MLKKLKIFTTCFLLLISTVPNTITYAEDAYIKFYNGAIEMRFIDTAAGTGTTYHTVDGCYIKI